MTAQIKIHFCLNCGEEIVKKAYESVNRYNSRKFDSPECSREYMRKNRIGWFSPGMLSIKESSFSHDNNSA